MKRATTFLFVLMLVVPAMAQQGTRISPDRLRLAPQAQQADQDRQGPQPLHITDQLIASTEGQAALQTYQRLKETGQLPRASKTAAACTLNETRTFKVRNLQAETFTQDTLEFTCKGVDALFNIWVETTELTTRVSDTDIDAIQEALGEKTPAGSHDTNKGIIAIDQEIFGAPPDFDGDGRLDVLLVNVRDNYDPNTNPAFIAGFFDPVDLGGSGNSADIIYLDTFPGMNNGVLGLLQTIAHEYQHLIHSSFGIELTFVNEGLSEWAERVNGYNPRFISYLNQVSEQNCPLLDWDNCSSSVLNDYQRAGLFTNYIAERIGSVETGKITRRTESGADGYQAVLSQNGLDLKDLVTDFHIANTLNDRSVDPNYGYTTPRYLDVMASPSRTIDGVSVSSTANTEISLQAGGVQYIRWTDVTDFNLNIDAKGAEILLPSIRATLRPYLLLKPETGPFQMAALTPQPDAQTFIGTYDEILLVLPHIAIDRPVPSVVAYSASWNTGGGSVVTELVQHDSGDLLTNLVFFFSGQEDQVLTATRFDLPEPNAILGKVFIAPLFLGHFPGSFPDEAAQPKDLRIIVWDDNDGIPGNELVSTEITRNFPFPIDVSCWNDDEANDCPITSWSEIDLSAFKDVLGRAGKTSVSGPLYVGYGNVGTDANYFLGTASRNADANYSFLGNTDTPGAWRVWWDIQFTSGTTDPLKNTLIPTRAEFIIPEEGTATEEESTVPQRITLEQNYPNPFNPTTAINYALAQPTRVHLSVYDLLGRRVAMLADGLQPAGRHTVRFDATDRSSGMYFYTLETDDGTKLTRTMLLVK